MRRRAYLVSAGAIAATGMTTGCISSLQETINPSVQLAWFGIHNSDMGSSHQFDLRVIRDGTQVHSSSHKVKAAQPFGNGRYSDGAVAKCTWGSTAGEYTVRARADNGEWEEKSVTEFAKANDVDSVVADAWYDHSALGIRLVDEWERNEYERMCPFAAE